MRRVLIIGLLLLLMYALQLLQVRTDAPVNPQSLATLGFVLLAAYTLGEITNTFGLPKITGYIITGIIFGPYAVNLFSMGVVSDLKLIDELAVGLIALTAGGEMKLSRLKTVARSLTTIVLIKGSLIFAVITLTVLAARPLFPFLADASTWLTLSVGMIFGVLAIGTSPAATIAVINETESRGRLTDITLGAAVAKDVVMVVLLAVAISLTKLFSTPGASFDPAVLLTVGQELLLSIIAGIGLGAIIVAYIRFVHAEMWLFIVGAILFASTVSEQFHLDALLVFITAGFVVQNASRYGDELIHPIERLSLPVYVVFFSIAGADLNLNALKQVWPIALILFAVRIGAIYVGTRAATTVANEPPEIKQNAWLSFIAQAAVVLGLSIIVESNLPGLGSEIKTIVVATIALNLILGPATFKIALTRIGETAEERDKRGTASVADQEEPAEAAPPHEVPQPPTVHFPKPEFPSTELNQAAVTLREALLALQRDIEETFLDEQTARLHRFIERTQSQYLTALSQLAEQVESIPYEKREALIHCLRESRTTYSRQLLSDVTEFVAGDEVTEISKRAFREFFTAVNALCAEAPRSMTVVQEPERYQPAPDDSTYVSLVKALKRQFNALRRLFGSGAGLKRVVYFQRLVKFHLGGRLPSQLIKVANLIAAQTLVALKKSNILYTHIEEGYEAMITHLEGEPEDGADSLDLGHALGQMNQDIQEDFQEVRLDLERYHDDILRQLASVLSRTYGALLKDLEIAGTFELPRRQFRYSKLYEKSEKAKSEISLIFERWRKYHTGFAGNYAKHIEVIMLMDNASRVVDETVASVLESIDEKLIANVSATKEQCDRAYQHLAASFEANGSITGLKQEITSQQEKINNFIQHDALKKLNHLLKSRELNGLIDLMLQRFAVLADQMPREYLVLDDDEFPLNDIDGVTPPDVRLKPAPLREVTRSYLETEIARDLADVNHTMFEQVNETIQSVMEVSQFVNFNLKTSLEELERLPDHEPPVDDMTHAKELALGGIRRGIAKLEAALQTIHEVKGNVYDQILIHVDERMRAIETLILERTLFDIKAHLRKKRAMDRGFLYLRVAWRWLSRRIRRLIRKYKPVGQGVVKDLKTTLGLQQFTPSEILAIYDQAKLDSAALAHLPFIYQRLFDIRPLEGGDFLIGRRDELEIVETAKHRWQQGMPCSVAVIGEVGSGKTSFINAMLQQVLSEYPVHKKLFMETIVRPEDLAAHLSELFGFSTATTFDDLQQRLTKLTDRRVVVLEDAHKLYLRTLTGFEALKRFLLLVAATSHHILWVISMREYAWRYLDNAVNISEHFTFVINTENVSRDEIEQVIFSRHRVSGFDLRFLPGPAMQQRKKYRRASDKAKQEILRKAFFDELSRASEGNILAAIFYWLRSLRDVEGSELIVNPLRKLNFDFLRDMPAEKLLIFGIISQHENLTARECAQIFGIDVESCLSTLIYLTNINILVKETGKDGQDRFAINRLIYKPLSKELRARNILH